MKEIKNIADFQNIVEALVGDWHHVFLVNVAVLEKGSRGQYGLELRFFRFDEDTKEEWFLSKISMSSYLSEVLREAAYVAQCCKDEDIVFYKNDDSDVLEILGEEE